jgi:hypothetical protein
MRTGIAVLLLLLVVGAAPLHAQVEESVDSTEQADSGETVTTSTTTNTTTTSFTSEIAFEPPARVTPPKWIHLVRLAAVAGPIAFLVLAWTIAAIVHVRLVRREQEQFPLMRGSRSTQITPLLISAVLLFVPVVLFVIFEIRSRKEIRLGIAGIVDEWQPVTAQAWITWLVCLVLALTPWLLARRADTVARGRA